jgi:STE24 endopeptidase
MMPSMTRTPVVLLFLLAALAPGLGLADTGAVAVPEATDTAWSYYYTRNTLWVVGLLWGLVVPAVVLLTGWSARIRDVARGRSRGWALTIVIYVAIYSVLELVVGLPFAYVSGYVVEHHFGLSNQSHAKWAADTFIEFTLGLAIGAVVVLGLYALLRASPRRWWLYGSLAAIPLILLVFLVTPIWIEPLFNKLGPMKDSALEAKIVALADRAGIEGARVFEVDKSEDTKKLNAYVTGFGATKRIVLWDTIIKRLDERELLFVMGHEMGHYVLHHVWISIAALGVLVLLSLYAVQRLAHGLIARYRLRFGFDRLDDIASYPLVGVVFALVVGIATPVFNVLTRYDEREADRFGLEITRDNRACGMAFVKLNADNLGIARPNPILQLLRGSHPTVAERVEFCNAYRPWERGEPLRYERYFGR